MGKGCALVRHAEPRAQDHARTITRVCCIGPLMTDDDGLLAPYKPVVHYDCSHNQERAAVNRVLGKTPEPSPPAIARLRQLARTLGKRLPRTQAIAVTDVPKLYTGQKRARYERAAADVVANGGVERRHFRCTMFVKAEKMNPRAKVDPDPRAIQFRDYRGGVNLARFLKPIEAHIYALAGDGKSLPQGKLIGKGLSMAARARLLREKWDGLRDPVAIVVDASRFDKHVSKELLEVEHLVYTNSNPADEFQQMLRWQLFNVVRSRNGLLYKTRGKRMSGDMNTAVGNCILMTLMICDAMRDVPCSDWNLLDDGDDCVLLVERAWLDQVIARLPGAFAEYGMKLKVEAVADVFENIDWCQSRPVYAADGWTMVRNPAKITSGAVSGQKYCEPGARQRLLATLGLCEGHLNRGVPVLQAFASCLLRSSDGARPLALVETDAIYHRIDRELRGRPLADFQPAAISNASRMSFYKAYGVPPSRQVTLERWLDQLRITTRGTMHPPDLAQAVWSDGYEPTSEVYRCGV